MTPTIQLASERTIIAQTLISILTNIRETYLPDLGAADAYELLLTGAHVLLAQTTQRPATVSSISHAIGRPPATVEAHLDALIKRGYVECIDNRYSMAAGFNAPHLRRSTRANIRAIQVAAKHLTPG